MDRVRFAIGDTDSADPQFSNEELLYLLKTNGSEGEAAAVAANGLAAKYARFADKQVGDLRISLHQRATAYRELAKRLTEAAAILGTPSAGGVFTADKEAWDADDAVLKPVIRLGIHDIT